MNKEIALQLLWNYMHMHHNHETTSVADLVYKSPPNTRSVRGTEGQRPKS